MLENLDKYSRIGLISAIIVLILLTTAVLIWTFSGGYSSLFSNLDEKEAANVITALEDMKVPYELSEGGKDISVDSSIVEQVRLKLIGKGVRIQSGEGFELFDDADIGMTEYSQKINYLRAMQGELARSVMSIDGIKYARVHLVLPETSVFKQSKQVPTASVTVIPEIGIQLSNDQIIGIQRMLAAATPGITQDNVTVLDNHGVTLSSVEQESSKEQITSLLLKKKHEAEAYLEAKVNAILDRTFGSGKSVATISVDLVIDKIHRKEEIVLPQSSKTDGVLRRRETNSGEKKEKTKNNNKSLEIEYQLSKRVEEVVSMPGAINRITVGIVVPENISTEVINQLKNIISMAVGLDLNRGDGVEIYPMARYLFDNSGQIALQTAAQTPLPEASPVTVLHQKDDATTSMNNGSVAYSNNSLTESAHNFNKYINYEQLLYLAGSFMLLTLLLLFLWFFRSNSGTRSTQLQLTAAEKEKLLSDLKQWTREGTT